MLSPSSTGLIVPHAAAMTHVLILIIIIIASQRPVKHQQQLTILFELISLNFQYTIG